MKPSDVITGVRKLPASHANVPVIVVLLADSKPSECSVDAIFDQHGKAKISVMRDLRIPDETINQIIAAGTGEVMRMEQVQRPNNFGSIGDVDADATVIH